MKGINQVQLKLNQMGNVLAKLDSMRCLPQMAHVSQKLHFK